MLIRRKKHRVPALNTASTADISFMLLIFFLVTTSMDVDKGITRQLPPVDQTTDNSMLEVQRDRIMQITVGADGSITVDGHTVRATALAGKIAAFVQRVGAGHLITLHTAADAPYDSYFAVQSALADAYAAVRDREAVRRYGRHMAQLAPAQRKAVADACAQHVAENYDNDGLHGNGGKGGGE